MISFENDYSAGAHPKLLERLSETNLEPLPGYETDRYCESAARKIREACGCPEAEVYFLAGGTQTNAVVISSVLRSYEGVLAAEEGHIALFFVDPAVHRKGIGRGLFQAYLAAGGRGRVTVHSSPYAVEVYRHLGFSPTAGERLSPDGIRYTPMVWEKKTNAQ